MRQSIWEAWFIASVILVVSVTLWGTIAQTETPTYLVVISVISINLAVCLYHGSKYK